MGKYNNLGAKFGFIVCSDIPNLAYGLTGYSLRNALASDFKRNPSAYNSANGNTPSNPYFHRRARNLYAYFSSIARLEPIDYRPSMGDLAFYRNTKNGWVNHVALVSSTNQKGYSIIESAPKTVLTQEVDAESPIGRGWILSGFGSLY